MLRALEHVGGSAELDDAPEVHHRDAVAERPGRADVVRDQEQRQPAGAAQAEQQVQHLGAHGDVERRDRLVAHEPRGLGCERAGDRDALALPARELVRIAVPEALRGRESGVLERARGAQDALGARHALHAQRLLHELAHLHARVERLVRILEHHLQLLAQRAQATAIEGGALEAQLTAARLLETEQRARERRLAAARLADDAEHLVPAPLEVDAVERAHDAAAPAELDLESARLGQRRDGGGERG